MVFEGCLGRTMDTGQWTHFNPLSTVSGGGRGGGGRGGEVGGGGVGRGGGGGEGGGASGLDWGGPAHPHTPRTQ